MKLLSFLAFFILLSSCKTEIKIEENISEKAIKEIINSSLNQWHKAAAEADFESYFDLMTNDGVFIGTDATENWQNKAFKTFSKPYFDEGKAWSFIPLERNIYIYEDKKIAWFDELLDTQMKLCRGSGIMVLQDKQWKIKHYVLSIAVPNENVSEVVKLKTVADSLYTKKLKPNN